MKISMKSLMAFLSALVIVPSVSFAASAFSDVKEDDFGYNAINYLKNEGIVEGYLDGSFKPTSRINRAEFLKIVMEAAVKEELITGDIEGKNCFSDVKDQWFAPYVCKANDLGIVNGYPDGKFYPEKEINFVEASKIIVNALGLEMDSSYNENWYEPYVVSLEKKRAIPYTVVNFSYLISRADMACMVSQISWSNGGNDCISDLTYSKVRGLSSLKGDKVKLSGIGNQVVAFYMVDNQVYIIDIYGGAYLLDKANPDTFKYLVGDLYYDNENIFNIYIDDLDPGELSSKITVVYKPDFELSSLEPMEIETEMNTSFGIYSFDPRFFKDKSNSYVSCGHHGIDSFVKIDGFDSNNFKIIKQIEIIYDISYLTYFTDSKRLFVSFSGPSSNYNCQVSVADIDLDSLEMIFDKPVNAMNENSGGLIFLKDKNNVYDPFNLSVLDWLKPDESEVLSVEYTNWPYPDEQKYFYYVKVGNKVWVKDEDDAEFVLNQEIDATTFDLVGMFEYQVTPYPGYRVQQFGYSDSGICKSLAEQFGDDFMLELGNGVQNKLLLNADGSCTILDISPAESGEDSYSIYGFVMKDKNSVWIFDEISAELKKISISVDVASFEAISSQYKGFFRDKDYVYMNKNNSLIVVDGMDPTTFEVVDDDNGGYFSDKNGKWEYDKDGVLKLN